MIRSQPPRDDNDSGVSPVIAVILMVAITVVLSGFVFVWASSFTSDPGSHIDLTMFEVIAKDDPAGDFIVISVMKGTEDWDKSKVIVTPNGGAAIFGDFSGMPNQSTAGDDVQLDTFVDENGAPAVLSYSKGERVNVRIVSLNNNEVQFHTDLIAS